VIGGIGFFEEDEVQAILAVLFSLWNPDDRLAFAAALKSPLFAWRTGPCRSPAEGESFSEGLRQSRPEIAETLSRWRDLAGVAPLSHLIHRIIGDTGAYVRFGRRSSQAIFNLDKLLDTPGSSTARLYHAAGLRRMGEGIRATEQREASADMNLPGDKGAVSIMTVHKAKGLEFSVVFLPGMNQQPLSSGKAADAHRGGRRALQMSWKAAGGPAYAGMWTREQGELQQEQQRCSMSP